MNTFTKSATIALFLLARATLADAAGASTYNYRVHENGLKSSGTSDTPPADPSKSGTQPPAVGVVATVYELMPRGCYHNGNAIFTPLWDHDTGNDVAICQGYVGWYAYNDVFTMQDSDPLILMNSTYDGVTNAGQITYSSATPDGFCDVHFAIGPEGGVSESSGGTWLSARDLALCVNNQAVGKYVGTISHSQPTPTAVTDLVTPVSGLQTKITTSVPGSGCMISYGPSEAKYQYVPNYVENGVNLCQEDAKVYYRAATQSISAKP